MENLIQEIKEGKYGEVTFAIMKVQNAYSSGDRGIHYGWCSDLESEDVKSFKKSMKRRLENLQRKHFYDIVIGGGSAKYYSHLKIENFVKDFKARTGSDVNLKNLF